MSRLYQTLRLDRPLVYGVQGRLECYTDTGLWWIQTVAPVQHLAICRQRVETVWQTLAATGPTSAELACTLAHLQARVQLEADDSQASMERLASVAWINVGCVLRAIYHVKYIYTDKNVRRTRPTLARSGEFLDLVLAKR